MLCERTIKCAGDFLHSIGHRGRIAQSSDDIVVSGPTVHLRYDFTADVGKYNARMGGSQANPQKRHYGWLAAMAAACIVLLAAIMGSSRPGPAVDRREIAPGVIYRELNLPRGPHGGGRVYVVEADLAHPAIELYTTHPSGRPPWPFRLRHVWQEAAANDLVVAVNGVMFTTWARQSLVHREIYFAADRAVNSLPIAVEGHAWPTGSKCMMIWADEHGIFSARSPFSTEQPALDSASWALAGGYRFIHYGKPIPYGFKNPGRATPRTVIGVEPGTQRLWLLVFEKADRALVTQTLIDLKVSSAINVDGGGSSCLVIGPAADGIEAGTRFGGARPVAMTIGVSVKR